MPAAPRPSALLALGLLAASAAPPAAAEGDLVSARDPGALRDIIQELGYRALLSADAGGDPLIETAAEGAVFNLFFYGCTDGAECRAIQFRAGFDLPDGLSLQAVNAWNHDRLLGKVYLDDEFDPWIEWTVNLDHGGVTRRNFEDAFDWWVAALGEFIDYIDW